VDLSFFQLCNSCLRATQIEDVDFSAISLQGKCYDILQNCFQANKPASLVIPPKKIRDQDDEPKIQKEEKDKFPYKDLGIMIRNTTQILDWKIPGFKYKQNLTKDIIATTPCFYSTGMTACNKWHIQGFCYEKCDHHATHKPFKSASHKSSYDKW
jgi:hypothetical protein